MKHRIFLNDKHYIESVYDGDLNFGELQKIFEETYKLGFQLQDSRETVRSLVDLSKLGRVPITELKSLVTMGIKSFPFNKIAVFGARKEIEMMVKMVMALAGKRKILGVFKTRDQAVKWLGEN